MIIPASILEPFGYTDVPTISRKLSHTDIIRALKDVVCDEEWPLPYAYALEQKAYEAGAFYCLATVHNLIKDNSWIVTVTLSMEGADFGVRVYFDKNGIYLPDNHHKWPY